MADISEIRRNVRQKLSFAEGVETKEHRDLLTLVKSLKRRGSDSVKDRIAGMENADRIYRAYRVPDTDDRKSAERGEPVKIVYPVAYAQVQTALATLMSIFIQNPYFPLDGRGPGDYKNSKLMEMSIQHQLDSIGYSMIVYQWLLDSLKYGFGKIDIGYVVNKGFVVDEEGPLRQIPILGALFGLKERTREVILSEGAAIQNEDPYTIMFDPDVNIGEFQKGNFVFSYKQRTLNEMRDSGDYFNLKPLPNAVSNVVDTYQKMRRVRRVTTGKGTGMPDQQLKGGDWIDLDVCRVKLVPKDLGLSDNTRTEIWKITMGNDAVIVQAEPSRFEHGMFPGAIIESSPDMHESTNDGLIQTIEPLENLMNWFLNSHTEAVKRTVNNMALIDPDAIHIEDLEKKRNYIRMKRGKSPLIDRVFRQIKFDDVTRNHVNDASSILTFIQRTTGFSDNSMGIQLPTGRTATEVAAIQRLGSLRSRLLAQTQYEQGFRPLGKQLIQNTQQFMSTDHFIRVTSDLADFIGVDLNSLDGDLLRITPQDLRGVYDIRFIDLNTPQDKMVAIGMLKEIVLAAVQNPQAVAMLGIKPKEAFRRMLELAAIPGAADIIESGPSMNPVEASMMQSVTDAAINGRGAQAQVSPDEMVQKEAEKGNLIPFSPDEVGNNGRFPGA